MAALQAPTEAEQVRTFREVLDIAAENTWTINIAEAPPFLAVVSQDLHNVPRNALYSAVTKTPANAGFETYYFGHPNHNAVADTRDKLGIYTRTGLLGASSDGSIPLLTGGDGPLAD